TVRIRGVYDAAVGAGSPVLTRLTQWKIVPKRALEPENVTAPSRSSVNNCTLSDLSQPLNRRARRALTERIKRIRPGAAAPFVFERDPQNGVP
ncbi:replication endonuclease, partial [Enterobacter quasiroggenkampii]